MKNIVLIIAAIGVAAAASGSATAATHRHRHHHLASNINVPTVICYSPAPGQPLVAGCVAIHSLLRQRYLGWNDERTLGIPSR